MRFSLSQNVDKVALTIASWSDTTAVLFSVNGVEGASTKSASEVQEFVLSKASKTLTIATAMSGKRGYILNMELFAKAA